ncbi:hypothetical protein AArc1_5148 (plasmid) [Natrarchaeobaculum sulfurireducens]|uniref:DUF7344 domain-containing protein n=2 Tax=Natrarchaeobaculum sulfurireducens TaxID=2044521 RepID=A0A346PA04_9EURY|nr:hypothetical protein AArc1_5148 [Natrarchaeobaculum sulfurireducens]
MTRHQPSDGSSPLKLSHQGIDRETAYRILSNRRRRFVIHYLMTTDEKISLRALSEQVAAWENGISRDKVTSTQRKRVYTALHQAHLPKLSTVGLVEYDTRQKVIGPTENIDTLQVYLDVVSEDDIPWSVFYTGTALVFATSVLLGWVGLVPFALLSGYAWAMLLSATFVGIGAVNLYQNRQNRLGANHLPPEVTLDADNVVTD